MRHQERRDPAVHRHQQLGARHGRHPPGAGRGADQLLRVQLWQRARGDVGHVVPRDGARSRPRRCRRPERRPPRVEPAADSRLRGHLDDLPGAVQRGHQLPVPQRWGRRGSVRRVDGIIGRDAGAERARSARRRSRGGAAGRHPGDVLRLDLATAVRGVGRRPGRRRRPAARTVRRVLPAPARWHVGQRAGGVPVDRLHGPDRAANGGGVRRRGAAVQRGWAAGRAGHHGRLLLHLLPGVDGPPGGDHGRRGRPDRRHRNDGRRRRRRWRARGSWPRRWRTAGSSS